MWVRSQKKEKLANIDFATIDNFATINKNPIHIIGTQCGTDDAIRLGTYATKEKALKVMDILENHLNYLNWQNVYKNSLSEYSNDIYRDLVFQFPLDSEVNL